ncbi:MAG: 5'-methylthioadenosine/S-adenosylhomocysteine nucleosidase family protein [Gammaproteobacteria bacterium]
MKKRNGCVIVFATLPEAEPLILRIGAERSSEETFTVFHADARPHRQAITVIVSGMGLLSARKAMRFVFARYEPGFVLNCGIAGSLSGDFEIGGIFAIERTGTVFHRKNRPGIDWVAADLIRPAGCRAARLASVRDPLFDRRRKSGLSPLADLVDMEAAAVAQACTKNKTPCGILKIVSDDAENRQLLLDNLHGLSARLAEHIQPELNHLISQRRIA